jgi:hypothetical protein
MFQLEHTCSISAALRAWRLLSVALASTYAAPTPTSSRPRTTVPRVAKLTDQPSLECLAAPVEFVDAGALTVRATGVGDGLTGSSFSYPDGRPTRRPDERGIGERQWPRSAHQTVPAGRDPRRRGRIQRRCKDGVSERLWLRRCGHPRAVALGAKRERTPDASVALVSFPKQKPGPRRAVQNRGPVGQRLVA